LYSIDDGPEIGKPSLGRVLAQDFKQINEPARRRKAGVKTRLRHARRIERKSANVIDARIDPASLGHSEL
jgi:hypothetical protein